MKLSKKPPLRQLADKLSGLLAPCPATPSSIGIPSVLTKPGGEKFVAVILFSIKIAFY